MCNQYQCFPHPLRTEEEMMTRCNNGELIVQQLLGVHLITLWCNRTKIKLSVTQAPKWDNRKAVSARDPHDATLSEAECQGSKIGPGWEGWHTPSLITGGLFGHTSGLEPNWYFYFQFIYNEDNLTT